VKLKCLRTLALIFDFMVQETANFNKSQWSKKTWPNAIFTLSRNKGKKTNHCFTNILDCFTIALPIGYVAFYQIPTFFVNVFFIINKLYCATSNGFVGGIWHAGRTLEIPVIMDCYYGLRYKNRLKTTVIQNCQFKLANKLVKYN